MTTTLRAALSVLLLVGFYVLALGAVVGLGAATVWAFSAHIGGGAAKLGFITVVVAVGLVVALVRVARAEKQEPGGMPLTDDDAPELWATVRELAQVADTRAPDEIRLVADVNAAVSEDTRLLGLVGGTRRLYLGVPLLQGLTAAQLRSVLAHELGHYSRSHTRLGPLTYRGRQSMVSVVRELDGTVVAWILAQYAKFFALVSAAVGRRQELEADLLSVRVAGRDTAQRALQELPALDAAWRHFLARYVEIGWEVGYAPTPESVFDGFENFLRERGEELTALRDSAPPAARSLWDSHPPISARVAAMAAARDVPAPVDDRSATALLPDFSELASRLVRQSVDYGTRRQVDWATLVAASMPLNDQQVADALFGAAASATGTGRSDLSTLLGAVSTGRLDDVRRVLIPATPREDAHEQLVGITEAALRAAAVSSGVATWRLSWSGPMELTGPKGDVLDLSGTARLALDPATAQDVPRHLDGLGIEVASPSPGRPTVRVPRGARGGLAPVTVGGLPHDVVVLRHGIVLVRRKVMLKSAGSRLAVLLQTPVEELVARHRLVEFDEIARVELRKVRPLRARIVLRDGTRLRLNVVRETVLSHDDADLELAQLLAAFVREGEPDAVPAG
ncbi:M48 family metallopeptidase [Cellulosimicrobium sp. 22601]|uniref:M48 family metallopeptidase n=1 Tax=unclassified Cellulosimicrobium TaxID=2624466 RepID=UPI003F85FB00